MTFHLKPWVVTGAVASVSAFWSSAHAQANTSPISMSEDVICVDQQLALDVVQKTGAPTGKRVLPILNADGALLATITRQQAIREDLESCSGQDINPVARRDKDDADVRQQSFADSGSSSNTLP